MMTMKNLTGLAITLVGLGAGFNAQANYWLNLGVTPFSINGYIDNSLCLKNGTGPCGNEFKKSGTVQIVFKPMFGDYGYAGFRNWDTSFVEIQPKGTLSSTTIEIKDATGQTAYQLKLTGNVWLSRKHVTYNNQNFVWEDCDGDQKSKTLEEALNGARMRCINNNKNSFLVGYELKYDISATLHRVGNGDLRMFDLPSGLDVHVQVNGESDFTGGNSSTFDGTANLFNGGKIKLNDRKCFIKINALNVNFGQMSQNPKEKFINEVQTSVPFYCSGYDDENNNTINGVGIKNTINGISVTAHESVGANNDGIAVPGQPNLYVEVSGNQEGNCGISSTKVDGSEYIGGQQVNGPVWDNPGRLDSQYQLYWRLCQKNVGVELKPGEFEKTPAATLRLHYN